MGDKSAIEWTEATKRCSRCRQIKPAAAFGKDSSRADGLTYWCRGCRNARQKALYQPKQYPQPGRRYVLPRSDDRRQARRRVNYLIEMGLLPAPNTQPCTDCGHVWQPAGRRHEYDHYRGYAPQHHEDVEAVCSKCHHERESRRRAAA